MQTRKDIIDYLVDEGEDGLFGHDRETLEEMSDRELFDAYLEWQGIIGFGNDIIDVLKALGVVNKDFE